MTHYLQLGNHFVVIPARDQKNRSWFPEAVSMNNTLAMSLAIFTRLCGSFAFYINQS